MGYNVQINGFAVRCESLSDLYAVTGRPAPSPGRNAKGGESEDEANDEHRRARALRSLNLLAAMRDGGADGLTGKELAKAAGIEKPSGLGTYRLQMQELLKSLNFNFADVVRQTRVNDVRRWARGPQISDAIKSLKEIVK
jgi:hypothetical protein